MYKVLAVFYVVSKRYTQKVNGKREGFKFFVQEGPLRTLVLQIKYRFKNVSGQDTQDNRDEYH